MAYRILITGSRSWTDRGIIREALRKAYNDAKLAGNSEILLISGACPKGADRICEEVWTANNLPLELHPADWKPYPERAGYIRKQVGYIRNAEMVQLGAQICLAFIKDGSKGASMTATLAEKAGVPTQRFTS